MNLKRMAVSENDRMGSASSNVTTVLPNDNVRLCEYLTHVHAQALQTRMENWEKAMVILKSVRMSQGGSLPIRPIKPRLRFN